jgi:CheY-like chemotaxis protein
LRQAQQTIIQSERLNALGEMASGIAHDFNNSLMPILGYSDLLLANPAILADAKEAASILKDMREAAMDASECVRRLREFYRTSPEPEPACGDVNKQIQTVIVLMRPKWQSEADAKGARIAIETDLADVPSVGIKESQLREMLINLLLNAIDAMPTGGTITFRTRLDGKRVILEIADTGTGMTEEVRRRCLEPFFTTKPTGSGLGLSMAYGLVQRSRGSLSIASARGEGARITISLPCHGGEPAPDTSPPRDMAPVRPMTILVIDDELSACRLYERALQADGHTVETAISGHEGLSKFRAGTFDLVIVDRAMPDLSGDNVVSAIRESDKQIPVVMATGFGDIMLDSGELPPGVNLVLSKPVSAQSLREAIAEAAARQSKKPA